MSKDRPREIDPPREPITVVSIHNVSTKGISIVRDVTVTPEKLERVLQLLNDRSE